MIYPLEEGRLTQLWGANPSFYQAKLGIPYHNGTDWGAREGSPIRCISDGIAVYTGTDPNGYGYYTRIYHSDLNLFSFYAHQRAIEVEVGSKFSEGEQIGQVGNTGMSTGPHLHFELRLAIDMYRYDVSPYSGIARGRVNPLTVYALLDRAERYAQPHD